MAARILIVDDEASIRELYRQELVEEGYEVDVLSSAEEAAEYLRKSPPDLMILDIQMGGQDGLSFLREQLPGHRQMPVIISSAYSSYKDDFSSWLADAYIVKSSDLQPLKDKVRVLLTQDANEGGDS